MAGRVALEVVVTAPVVSFRNPLYTSVQVGLPCPPPSTVGGMLAAAAGGWDAVDPHLRFAMAFQARGDGVDLETYHPLEATGKRSDSTPRERGFLADVSLTVWLWDDPELWWRRLRRPVWPLRLGRSQDLVGVALREVTLLDQPGRQGHAVVPLSETNTRLTGIRLRLPTAVALDRDWTRWDDYQYDPHGRSQEPLNEGWSDGAGQGVMPLPPTHPHGL